jgi:hypothetical protein
MEPILLEHCYNCIPFLQNNYNLSIALTIHEIYKNNIVYINKSNIWYKYNFYDKKWYLYDIYDILNKLTKFYDFFNHTIIDYLNYHQQILNDTNKKRFIFISKNIAKHILNDNICIHDILILLQNKFSIHKLI